MTAFSEVFKKVRDPTASGFSSLFSNQEQKFSIPKYGDIDAALTKDLSHLFLDPKFHPVHTRRDMKNVLELPFFQERAKFIAAASMRQTRDPVVDVSFTSDGTSAVSFWCEGMYHVKFGDFSNYTAGINVALPKSSASIILGDKGNSIKAAYVYHLDQRSAIMAEISRHFPTKKNTCSVGSSYTLDKLIFLAKIHSDGKIEALMQVKNPRFVTSIVGEMDRKGVESPKIGVQVSF